MRSSLPSRCRSWPRERWTRSARRSGSTSWRSTSRPVTAGRCSSASPRQPSRHRCRIARERLVFDDDAWRLAVQGDAPLVMHERAEWLVEHPFVPPADAWLLLPLGTRARPAGCRDRRRARPAGGQLGRRRGAARARRPPGRRHRGGAAAARARAHRASSANACASPPRSTTDSRRTSPSPSASWPCSTPGPAKRSPRRARRVCAPLSPPRTGRSARGWPASSPPRPWPGSSRRSKSCRPGSPSAACG